MTRTLALIAITSIVTLSTSGALAGTQDKKHDRKRDGSGENCSILGSQTRRGGGNGGGDRKRDGTGSNCTLLGSQTRQADRDRQRDDSCGDL